MKNRVGTDDYACAEYYINLSFYPYFTFFGAHTILAYNFTSHCGCVYSTFIGCARAHSFKQQPRECERSNRPHRGVKIIVMQHFFVRPFQHNVLCLLCRDDDVVRRLKILFFDEKEYLIFENKQIL